MKMTISKFFVLILFSIMLTACGGGGGTSDSGGGTTGSTTDSNKNGVRDDVDDLINSKPYSASQKVAITKYAKQLEVLLSSQDDEQILTSVNLMLTSVKGYYNEFGSDIVPLNEIKDKELDTRERMQDYMRCMSKISGQVFE